MSSAKYASITAGLLARKGEAQPWNHAGNQNDARADTHVATAEPEPISLPWRAYTPPEAVGAAPPPPPGKDRSCSIRMSAHDYERLGILAVKSDSTRQQLLKDALAEFLNAKAQDYGCACLGACNKNCGHEG
jgi:hypothetical protein